MNEHDDDLESEVIEDAQKEVDRFPDTDDDFADEVSDEQEDEDTAGDDDTSDW